ncbi:hypothetical protein PROFUN_16933 [Planoprotostelium fungivorum]|uniref:Uncharacterized protein n=1 Tax=Planoprotostelium fungivorum TaxID=1890364 RepID=A0A2P6MXP2_9EUKA|nr:hypothetical protein PROFUN_16933 [Planoprotostelium fungivorum]
MSLEVQLEETQKELENKIDFIRKQMIVIRAFNERFDQLDQTIMIQQTTEQRPESFASLFPPRLHKASTERTNTYKCFAEDYQTEHRRQAFRARASIQSSR